MEQIIETGISNNPYFINMLSKIQNKNLSEKEILLQQNIPIQENLKISNDLKNDEHLYLEYYDSDTEEINLPLSIKMTDHNPCREDETNLKNSKNNSFMKMLSVSNDESMFKLHDDEILSETDHLNHNERQLEEKSSYRGNYDENIYQEQLFTFDNNYRERMYLQSQNKLSETPSKITNSDSKIFSTPKISNRTIETDLINLLKAISDFKSQMMSNMELINNFYENLESEIMSTERGDIYHSQYEKNNEIFEKCLNSIKIIKINFLNTFEETENFFNFIPFKNSSAQILHTNLNSDTLKLNQSYDKNLSIKNNNMKNLHQIELDTSLQELVKINSLNLNKSYDINTSKNLSFNKSLNLTKNSLHSFSQLNSDKFNYNLPQKSDKNISLSRILNFNLQKEIQQSTTNNTKFENFNLEILNKIKSYYREKVLKINESKNAEINKLNSQIKNNEEIINSSKILIDEIYRKNKMLKDKLVKYKLLFDKNHQQCFREK